MHQVAVTGLHGLIFLRVATGESLLTRISTNAPMRRGMEDWDFVDDRDLQNWKDGVACMTCQHFIYGVDQHCHAMVGCNLRQKQLQQGKHLKKRCKL